MPAPIVRFSQSPDRLPLRVKLIGIGSAGCNIIEGAPFPTVAFTTSSTDITRSHADRKFAIGQDRLIGLSDPSSSVLKQMPEIVGHEIPDLFNNTDLVFLMCGLGGLTGSLGSKLVSSVARAKGVTAIAHVVSPFSAESFRRREIASQALNELLGSTSLCVEFANDKLSSLGSNIQLSRAFGILNGIMLRPAMDISSIMSRQDIGAFRQVIGDATRARFGLGLARGDDRVHRAVQEALSSPWFDFDLKESTAAIAAYSASDPWDKEAEKILGSLKSVLPETAILWGQYSDQSLGERIRLSLILCRKR